MEPESLEERLDADWAPAWRPEAGEKLVGEVTALDKRTGYGGHEYAVLTVRAEDGQEWSVHAFHSVLANELREAKPKVGERIGVKYLGQREGAGGSSYHAYRVLIDRDQQAFEWDESDGDEAAAAATQLHAPLEETSPSDDEDIPF